MELERHQRAWEILGACLASDAGERDGILDDACAGDRALRAEVEALLGAHAESGSFLERDETTAPTRPAAARAEPAAGQRIGPYKLLGLLSRGGMGTVYLAVRKYGEFEKRVALKLLQPEMAEQEEVRWRFRTESRILAALDHPNIARFLDAGSEEGQHYFVIEYVEGQPVDEYCDAHKLATRERLELFRTVCAAVQFAHQNTVVHRDLKPANILVTAAGVPKLLDFGIAKLLNPEIFSRSSAPTVLKPYTPEYASPEQVRGEPITTASDVYSLGVLLYELLTGHRPYRFSSYVPGEVVRTICEAEPERPSTVVLRREEVPGPRGIEVLTPRSVSETRDGEPGKLRRRLAGDLDNIVLKALRKEPQRRYSSVEQLSEDLRRHLEGRPVSARGDSVAYRAGKFVRRHRLGVTAAAAFVLALLGFGIAMAVQHVRLQEALAGEEFVTEFLIDLFEVSDPLAPAGEPVSARKVLDRGRDRLATELHQRPEVQAKLRGAIGTIYGKLGEYDEAERLLRRSLAARRNLFGGPDPEVASNLNALAGVLRAKGEYDEVETLLREALEMRRALFGDRHSATAESLNDLASLLGFRGDFENAEALYREAIAIFRLDNDREQLANTLNNLANLLQGRGELAAAERLFREALAIRREVLGPEHTLVANSLHNLAALLQKTGENVSAEALYRESLAILRQKLGDHHPWVGFSLAALASLLIEVREHAEAERLVQEALTILRATLPEDHWQIHYADSMRGACLTGLGLAIASEPVLLASYEALKVQQGDGSPYAQKALKYLIALYEAWGREDRAAEHRSALGG